MSNSIESFAGFDAELAAPVAAAAAAGIEVGMALSGDLPATPAGSADFGLHPGAFTAFEIGLSYGAPSEVMVDFLAALGLDAAADASLLLDFDAEDLTEARRAFFVGGAPATPLHKATVSSWLRHVTSALGTRPPSMLDWGFTAPIASAPPRELAPAPEAPATLPFADHSRAAPRDVMAAVAPGLRPPLFAAPAKAAGMPPVLYTPPAVAAVAVPMRDIIDQTHQGHFVPLSDQEVEQAWALHVRLTGLKPKPESEPSAEQLGALRAKLRAGEPPCVDFAVWGPFDRRHAKDRRSLGLVFVEAAPGQPTLQTRTLHGPSSFEVWERHWSVFSTAMLALGAAAPGPLGRYRDGISDLHVLYGPALWGLISRADDAMRSEQWRRMASETPPGGDWSAIIAASSYFEEGLRQWWWDRHVCKPAVEGRPASAHAVVNALEGFTPRLAAGAPQQPPHAQPSPRDEQPSKRQRRRGGGRVAVSAAVADAPPPPPRAAAQPPQRPKGACFDYNVDRCTGGDEACSNGFVHHCVICGDRHAASRVAGCKDRIDAMGRPTTGGKGAGKQGKGRGAGRK